MSNPYQNQSPPRRRRADRHYPERADEAPRRAAFPPEEEQAPMPLVGYDAATRPRPQAPQAPDMRPAPRVYQEEDYAPPRRDPEPYRRDHYNDDYYDDDPPPRRWPAVLAGLLVLVIALLAASYFLIPQNATGILGKAKKVASTVVDGGLNLVGLGKKEPPTLIKFETPETQVYTGVKTVFTFTADGPIEGVRVLNAAGVPIMGAALPVDQPDNKVWTFSAVIDEPISGALTAGIQFNDTWYQTDKSLNLTVISPSPEPTPVPTPEPTLEPTPEPAPEATPEPVTEVTPLVVGVALETPTPVPVSQLLPVFTPAPEPVAEVIPPEFPEEDIPEDMLVYEDATALYPEEAAELPAEELPDDMVAAEEPQPLYPEEQAAEPQPLYPEEQAAETMPVAEPVAEVIPEIQATPEPLLTVQAAEGAAPGKLGIAEDVWQGAKKQSGYSRETPINMGHGSAYTIYEGGVFTFRGDAFRQNAAFGNATLNLKQLTTLWESEMGSMRTGDSGTLYGMGWTGQPAIIKWSVEIRDMMNLNEDKKAVKALKEVIAAGQDGKVYFVDLNDGVKTREPIDVGFPLKGSVAVDTQGRPIIAFGQGISKLPSKTGAIGLHVYNLIDQKQLMFLNGRRTDKQKQYSTNGAFDGTALFDLNSDSMVVAGENGLLYTIKLNSVFDYLDKKTITLDPQTIYLRSKTSKQKDPTVSVESSVAMYGPYAYYADRQGILRCVDTTSMQTLWAFDTGDNTDATVALELDGNGGLGLYTGTTVFARLRRDKNAVIRRMDALTGEVVWEQKVEAAYDKEERSGVKASPVVGQNSIGHLVIFTVNETAKGATVLAMDKQTGNIAWQMPIAGGAISSPVAVYDEGGQAVIIQAALDGKVYMLDGLTGQIHHTLDLGGRIEASPAVYNDVLVIATSSRDNHKLYGIRIE
ncbi:MAG: PQQ-binding-like beta-propeller repeat protein [Christensenellales bacterium]